MRDGEGRGRLRVIATSLVLLSITFITLDIRNASVVESFKSDVGDWLTGTDGFFSHLTSPIRNAWHGIGEYDDLKTQNSKLKDEVARLKGRDVSDQIAGQKLSEISKLDQLTAGLPYEMVTARRTSSSGSNFSADSLFIDKGESSGLSAGMPVVVAAAEAPADKVAYPTQLVGVVEIVYSHKALVRLISSPQLRFGVRLIQSGQVAVGHGGGSDGATFRPWLIDVGIDLDAEIPSGDIVVTSSASDYPTFPGDIPVGKVARQRLVDAENRQELEVEPWVDISSLEFFRVIRWTPALLPDGTAPPTTPATTTTVAPDDGLMDPGDPSQTSNSVVPSTVSVPSTVTGQ